MNTDKALELLEEFTKNGISHDPKNGKLQAVLDFQDCVMQANEPDLFEFYTGQAAHVRQHFTWAVFNTLDQATALRILEITAGRALKKKYREQAEAYLEKELDSIYKRENIMREGKKHIFKKIRQLEDEKADIARQLKNARIELNNSRDISKKLRERNVNLEITYGEKAHRFDTLRGNLQAVLGWSEQE